MNTNHEQFEILLKHALEENDSTLHAMLQSYCQHPEEWSEFLVEVILVQSLLNKDLHVRLVEEIMRRPPPPVYVSQSQHVPDGARSDDYPVAFAPDGS